MLPKARESRASELRWLPTELFGMLLYMKMQMRSNLGKGLVYETLPYICCTKYPMSIECTYTVAIAPFWGNLSQISLACRDSMQRRPGSRLSSLGGHNWISPFGYQQTGSYKETCNKKEGWKRSGFWITFGQWCTLRPLLSNTSLNR